jgi:hypothetical protein
MKQTAVEYLLDNLYLRDTLKWKDIEESAKAMEREQIEDSYDAGLFDGTMDDVKDRIYKKYYNETYES